MHACTLPPAVGAGVCRQDAVHVLPHLNLVEAGGGAEERGGQVGPGCSGGCDEVLARRGAARGPGPPEGSIPAMSQISRTLLSRES